MIGSSSLSLNNETKNEAIIDMTFWIFSLGNRAKLVIRGGKRHRTSDQPLFSNYRPVKIKSSSDNQDD